MAAAAVAACLAAGLTGQVPPASGTAHPAAPTEMSVSAAAGNPFCQRLGKHFLASSAAWMFCRTAQRGSSAPLAGARAAGNPGVDAPGDHVPGAPGNVDAANPRADVSPGGLRGYGQPEPSVAASGQYVVEAWNDATGLFSACPSSKAQLTWFGFSSDGGKSFTDLQGLPDAKCSNGPTGDIYEGDPSVTAYRAGGKTYFYISSLFDNFMGRGRSFVALAACRVTGSGSGARLRCGQPVTAAASTQCQTFGPEPSDRVCSFLDKDYLAIDPAHGRLYAAFTEFGTTDAGAIEASVCDLGTRAGRRGPAGGTPAAPACEHGTGLHKTGLDMLAGKPYLTIQHPDPQGCEYEGAYPAADTATGNLYVGYESNWATGLGSPFGPDACRSKHVQNVVTEIPRHCLALRTVSPCAAPAARASAPVNSIAAANLPGFVPPSLPNDFPRLAVSDRARTVSMVWNDTRFHPDGDVLLQSFSLSALHRVQHAPVVLDTPHHGGLTFMPAVRTATAGGLLDVTWYSRDSASTTDTTLRGALGVRPGATTTPAFNITITSEASDWAHQNFDATPNFGDYTDNALTATGRKPYVGGTLYVAWTDGRTGVPQPFEAHLPAGS